MIKEQYISLDTARMLKEASFDVPCRRHYTKSGSTWETIVPETIDESRDFTWFPCPTQTLAARWLREVHKIHVSPDFNRKGWYYILYDITNEERLDVSDRYEISYEQALENGIQAAIKLI